MFMTQIFLGPKKFLIQIFLYQNFFEPTFHFDQHLYYAAEA